MAIRVHRRSGVFPVVIPPHECLNRRCCIVNDSPVRQVRPGPFFSRRGSSPTGMFVCGNDAGDIPFDLAEFIELDQKAFAHVIDGAILLPST